MIFFNYDDRLALDDERLLEEARARILNIRRGLIPLDFGLANAGKNVTVRQVSHSFRFGCNAYQFDSSSNVTLNQEYRDLFSWLFNYATVPFYWTSYEWTRNVFSYDAYLHNMSAWLASFNATVKGHPIIWQIDGLAPPWMEILNQSAQRQAALDHIDTVLSRFPEIYVWDLVNEMTHVPNTWLGSTPVETWETALARGRIARNDCEFIANEYTLGDMQDTRPFYDFVSSIKEDGYAPDALGFQCHTIDFWLPLRSIVDTFDAFGGFKIPMHITEFVPGSNGTYNGGTRRGRMTEETQAEWAERAYTMFFSHPAVQGITWWDFSNIASGAWMGEYGAYFMAADGRVLPVYDRLFDLIHRQWNSSTTITLDATGQFAFTGFYGNYTCTIQGSPASPFQILDNRTADERPWRTTDII